MAFSICSNFSEILDRIAICYQLSMFECAGVVSIIMFLI